uniref:L1 transposable element RRM domain-containing protein n=1 Tax=Acanthochromis polyacanthus TaxID=80966 RepID=A0A3Q1FL37_9TELE
MFSYILRTSSSDAAKIGCGKPRPSPEEPAPPESPFEPDADEQLLTRMAQMMEDMRLDIVGRFEKIVSDTVKQEVTAALGPLDAKITSHGETITDLECAADDHSERTTSLDATVASLTARADSLARHCEDLEGRSRMNNIRLVGIPEGLEGARATEFLPTLDRAHRIPRPKPGDGGPPRAFIVRVTSFHQRNEILCKAGAITPLIHNGKRISVFPDCTSAVAKMRAAFTTVKKDLCSCPGVKFGLFYPAVLRITLPDGRVQRFEDHSAWTLLNPHPDCTLLLLMNRARQPCQAL